MADSNLQLKIVKDFTLISAIWKYNEIISNYIILVIEIMINDKNDKDKKEYARISLIEICFINYKISSI